MAEENKPKSYDQIIKENVQKEKDRIERMEEMRLQTMQRLTTDVAIQKYFEQYSPHSVKSFIQTYSHSKASYMEYGEQFGKYSEKRNMAYYEDAYLSLIHIQLKKLFDLYCQWAANKITLPGMEASSDFLSISYDVLNCSFIAPITQQEFQLYLSYAATDNFVREPENYWNDFADVRSHNEGETAQLPQWFVYHNIHTGAGRYLVLPDLRGEKEDFYRGLAQAERNASFEKKYETGELPLPQPADKRPHLNPFEYDHVFKFVKQFEDSSTRKKFIGMQEFHSTLSKNDDVEDNEYLNEQAEEIAGEMIKVTPAPAIEAHADWRVALINTWHKYEKEQTIAALPIAFEDYLFHINNQILFEKTKRHSDMTDLTNHLKTMIIRGRELNGEPPDFNF